MKAIKKVLSVMATLMVVSTAAQATLFDRGRGLIYDSELNVTWLQDANYAKTSGFDADGLMTRNRANNWANNLVYDGYNDWRLPNARRTDRFCTDALNPAGTPLDSIGFNCSLSELAHMYKFNLGLVGLENFSGDVQANGGLFQDGQDHSGEQRDLGLFKNIQASVYWYRTNLASLPDLSYVFDFDDGFQFAFPRATPGPDPEFHAWALRTGDVTQVPEPSSLLLLGIALAGLGMAKRRRSCGA